MVIVGLVVSDVVAKDLAWDYLNLKKRFEPGALPATAKLSDVIKHEIKGSNLRADMRKEGGRNRKRRVFGILDATFDLLEKHSVTLVGKAYIKADGCAPAASAYPHAVSDIARDFQAQLAAADARGLMILDARTHWKNVPGVHGVTTQRYKAGGSQLPDLIESPVFGHSDSHVLLQIADLIASAVLYPLLCDAFCADLVGNVHVHPEYSSLRARYGLRTKNLEHRYTASDGTRRGGVVVKNKRNDIQTHQMYIGAPRPIQAALPISTRPDCD